MNTGRIFALLAGFPVMALAAPVDERIDATPNGAVEVRNLSGDIVVSGWDQEAVHVIGEISENAERLDVRREGDRVIVEVVYPENQQNRRRSVDDTDLIISIPRASSLNIETVSADISVSDVAGEQTLQSVSGDIATETVAAETRVESVSGDVFINGQDAAARTSANAVSGDVELNRISGEIYVNSVSGDIEIMSRLIERAEIESVSGDVSLQGEVGANARIRANSTSGDVDLSLRGEAAAEYNLTSFSGEIDNCFGPRATRSPAGPPSSALRFSEGSSGARVEVSTMSGDIGLCR